MIEVIRNINQIKTGYYLLVSSKGFLPQEIQNFEKCKWNHAGMFFWVKEVTIINGVTYQPGLYVAEMVARGFVLTPFDEYIKSTSGLLIGEPLFAVDEVAYWNYILPQLGHEKYGFFNLLIAQPIKFLTNYRIWLGDVDDNNPSRFICGEKVENIYNHSNPDIFTNWKRDAPSDIYKDYHFKQYLYQRS
jgi:hypothetical protein